MLTECRRSRRQLTGSAVRNGGKADGPLSATGSPSADFLHGPLPIATDHSKQLLGIGADAGPS